MATREHNRSRKPSFVFIHGGFHGAWTWHDVIPLLAAEGHAALAIDLPGAGSLTRFPRSFLTRPIDLDAFATELSPVRNISQDDRNLATIEAVKQAAVLGDDKVVVVGHSWGGLTIPHVVEAVPELIHSAVYLTALLIPDGVSGQDIFSHDSFSSSLVTPLFIGDPDTTGAQLRIDPRSEDPAYVRAMAQAFYHDVAPARVGAIANLLHCDEPLNTGVEPMRISAERFGRIARHYIRMADDRTLLPDAQDYMVTTFDASGIGGETTVHQMSGSHSPMFAQPQALVDVLVAIAAG